MLLHRNAVLRLLRTCVVLCLGRWLWVPTLKNRIYGESEVEILAFVLKQSETVNPGRTGPAWRPHKGRQTESQPDCQGAGHNTLENPTRRIQVRGPGLFYLECENLMNCCIKLWRSKWRACWVTERASWCRCCAVTAPKSHGSHFPFSELLSLLSSHCCSFWLSLHMTQRQHQCGRFACAGALHSGGL